MKLIKNLLAAAVALAVIGGAQAVPVLQVGAPDGAGGYADYQASTTNPSEDDTAITGGGTIYVGGVYQNNKVVNLGGQYNGGGNWSSLGLPSEFNGHGAVLVVSVPDGSLASVGLKVDGQVAFYTSATLSDLFPNNHAPLKDEVSDFLFYDIGNFSKVAGAVPDFASETGAADGQIKTLALTDFGTLAWAHLDAMAIQTSETNKGEIVTTWENNPGSHDVTWKKNGNGGHEEVPEPGSLLLLGGGMLGLWATRRRMA